jgi:hypothetical protein
LDRPLLALQVVQPVQEFLGCRVHRVFLLQSIVTDLY